MFVQHLDVDLDRKNYGGSINQFIIEHFDPFSDEAFIC